MRDAQKSAIVAVVVTYYPDNTRLDAVLRALVDSVDSVVVVDNGSPNVDEQRVRHAHPLAITRKLGTNKGLAAAQNEGIAMAKQLGASHILFLDQDSVPQSGMALHLMQTLEGLTARGLKVACVGPQSRAPGSASLSGFSRLGWFRLRMADCTNHELAAECDFPISSGSLIPTEVIDQIGGMEEGLFIDQVDTEWCLRARARGYHIFGDCGAVLEHRLGENIHRVW